MAKINDIRTSRLKVKVGKSVGLIVPIIFLFYLVLYLKENGFSSQSYFADYENAVTVWTVGLNFFRTIMNTLDSIIEVLGKILDFIVNSADAIISFFKDRVNSVVAVTSGSWFDRLASWARNVISNLMI
jgi:hypothetical protein